MAVLHPFSEAQQLKEHLSLAETSACHGDSDTRAAGHPESHKADKQMYQNAVKMSSSLFGQCPSSRLWPWATQ